MAYSVNIQQNIWHTVKYSVTAVNFIKLFISNSLHL